MRQFSLSEAAMAPIVLAVTWADGTTEQISLPLMRMRDYAPWLDAETERRKTNARKAIGNLPAIDKSRALFAIENEVATLTDLVRQIQTPAGGERILKASMTRAGLDAEKQQEILDVLPAGMQDDLAVRLSTLFQVPADSSPAADPNAPPATPAKSANPLADPAAATSATSDPAGEPTGSQTSSDSAPSSPNLSI